MGAAKPTFGLISSEDVQGTTVFDANGNEIGAIDHLMIDKVSGNVRYAVMSFGGFMGLGQRHYPLPWSSLTYDRDREGYLTNVTQQQLIEAPEYTDDKWSDRDWESRIHEHYRAEPYWDEASQTPSEGPPSTWRPM
jgi:hypothetical protein